MVRDNRVNPLFDACADAIEPHGGIGVTPKWTARLRCAVQIRGELLNDGHKLIGGEDVGPS